MDEINTDNMLTEITESILLSPEAEDKLKVILRSWAGKRIVDDM